MKGIEEFKIDKWVRDYGPKCRVKLHGSCASALSANDLQSLARTKESPIDLNLKLAYGASKGSLKLRERVAELHSTPERALTAEHVVITPGSIMANYLVLATICGPGDHVICQYPTYGQLYLLPRYNGVEVSLWTMEGENNWNPSLDELVKMIKPNTKAIILNNPNNPTGMVLSGEILNKVVAIAQKSKLIVFDDEVFRPLFYADEAPPPPLVTLGYPESVSTGSVSKAHGLPGIRVGWVVSQNLELLEKIVNLRDFTTLSVSQLDDGVAVFALSREVLPNLMQRNLSLCRQSVALIEDFVNCNSRRVRWVKPSGAGTAFVQLLGEDEQPVDEVAFCAALIEEEGVSVIPGGHCFQEEGTDDFKGYVRITLGEPVQLQDALSVMQRFISKFR